MSEAPTRSRIFDRDADEVVARLAAGRYVCLFIGGPTGAGKSTLADLVARRVRTILLPLDSYFVDLADVKMSRTLRFGQGPQWDHPSSFDLDHATSDLRALIRGESIQMPKYSFKINRRIGSRRVSNHSRRLLIVEGIHALLLADRLGRRDVLRIFVDADVSVRRDRIRERDRLLRDRPTADFERRFHFIRIAEQRWVLRYRHRADLLIDTS